MEPTTQQSRPSSTHLHPHGGRQREQTSLPATEPLRPGKKVEVRGTSFCSSNITSSNSHCPPNTPVGGRLKLHLHNWSKLTSDTFILESVRGYKLEFDEDKFPPQRSKPLYQHKRNQSETMSINKEIHKLRDKYVIEQCSHTDREFISNVFTRPKKDGGIRLILDLSELNKSVSYHHFKMDTIHTALPLLSPNSFLASIDLQDAYYTVPIDPDSRKFLRFMYRVSYGNSRPFQTV